MNYIFKFPDIGEGLDEGTIIEWLVKKGQKVKSGDLLVTMETDKVVAEIPSPKTGTIKALFGKQGEIVKVGDALVEIEIEGISGAEAMEEAQKSEFSAVEEEGAGVVGTLEVAGNNAVLPSGKEGLENSLAEINKISERKILATPVARALAKDLGIDINLIKGTGPAGRVMKEDIYSFSTKKTSIPQLAEHKIISEQNLTEIEPLSQIRKTIAKNMLLSKQKAPHMTVFDEVEIGELEKIRTRYKAKFAEKGVKLTYLAFVVKAVAQALKMYKSLNSEMDSENNQMLYKKYYNIGIAVDTERGLTVPVIRNADKLSIFEIADSLQIISEKARYGKLTMDDMKDGTFTITSYGSIGGKFAVPIINYPQAGILGVGRVAKQPVVKNDALTVGLVMPISITVDHRIVDGGEVTRFLNTILEFLSEPVALMMN